ncbi:MAG: hypothetical protein HY847_13675 [Betaproteobacteria bacterium]|nr:hypothetical protein [Betaproteobacteria bacterium]
MSEISVKLDYFSVTVFMQGDVGHKPVTDCILSDLLGLSGVDSSAYFEGQGFGGRGYSQVCLCPIPGLVFYRYPSSGSGHCHVEIKGEPLASISFDGVHRFLKGLEDADLTFRASRVDLAFDYVPCSPVELFNAWKARKVKTRLHYDSHDWRENSRGKTFYWGSVTSERQGICYDMRGFNRVELRCRQKTAAFLGVIVGEGNEHTLWAIGAGLINGLAQFPDDGNHWGWVQKIASGVNRHFVAVPQKKPVAQAVVARARERFMNLCAELAIIANALGIDSEMVSQTVASVTIDANSNKKIRDLQKVLGSL